MMVDEAPPDQRRQYREDLEQELDVPLGERRGDQQQVQAGDPHGDSDDDPRAGWDLAEVERDQRARDAMMGAGFGGPGEVARN